MSQHAQRNDALLRGCLFMKRKRKGWVVGWGPTPRSPLAGVLYVDLGFGRRRWVVRPLDIPNRYDWQHLGSGVSALGVTRRDVLDEIDPF